MAIPAKVARLSTMWYVLAPPEVTANHPITRQQERERQREREEKERQQLQSESGGAAAATSSFARLSGLPVSSSSASAAGGGGDAAGGSSTTATNTIIKTTDGATATDTEVYSPFPIGGFYALPTEEAVCELILQWFEDHELLRRRKAALVVVLNEHYDPAAAAAAERSGGGGGGGGGAAEGRIDTTSRTREEIQVQFPSVIEYDDVNVINFAEAYLSMIVVLEPKVTVAGNSGGRGGGSASSLAASGSFVEGVDDNNTAASMSPSAVLASALLSGATGRGGLGNSSPSTYYPHNNRAGEENPYVFHGCAWVTAALRRYFQRQAALTEQRDGM